MASRNITQDRSFNGPTDLSPREYRLLRKLLKGDFIYSLAIAPSMDIPGRFYIFRPFGTEVTIDLLNRRIAYTSHELNDYEKKYIEKNLIARQNTFIL